jgi:integrase
LVRKQIRVLTVDELWVMRSHAVEALRPLTFEERLERAGGDKRRMGGKDRGRDPLDVMDFLLSTGCRAGEVPGLEWADVHLDDDAPWVEIRQQVVRVPGQGLELTPTKEHDVRRLRLPGFAVDMLTRRLEDATGPMVFPSERGGLKAPRNIATAWKNTFRGSDWEWVTQKTLRKTVATLVDAEHGSQLASRQLGHASDGVTRRHYIAQSLVPIDAGQALEAYGSGRDEVSA